MSGLTYEEIPAEVRERIKLLMLDSLGCAHLRRRARMVPHPAATRSAAVDTTRTTSIWGTHATAVGAARGAGQRHAGAGLRARRRASPRRAACRRGGAAGADRGRRSCTPGMSGREFLTAAVAGYEIGPRVGMCMGQEHIGQGWHSGATVGVFSAAAGAARALGLDAEQTVHALGIAGTQAAGLMAAQYGAMVKRMHAGRSAQSGLYGALLAAATASPASSTCSRAPYGGFCTTFSRSQDRFNLDELSAGLGERFETMRHRAEVLFLRRQQPHHARRHPRDAGAPSVHADDIEEIVVHGSQVTVDHVGWPYEPKGLTSAQLNLPYLRGDAAARRRRLRRRSSREDCVADRGAHGAVAQGRRCVHDPAITALGARSAIWCASRCICATAQSSSETREAPRGSEQSFASRGHRRQVPQADARRHGGKQQDALVEAGARSRKLARQQASS